VTPECPRCGEPNDSGGEWCQECRDQYDEDYGVDDDGDDDDEEALP